MTICESVSFTMRQREKIVDETILMQSKIMIASSLKKRGKHRYEARRAFPRFFLRTCVSSFPRLHVLNHVIPVIPGNIVQLILIAEII